MGLHCSAPCTYKPPPSTRRKAEQKAHREGCRGRAEEVVCTADEDLVQRVNDITGKFRAAHALLLCTCATGREAAMESDAAAAPAYPKIPQYLGRLLMVCTEHFIRCSGLTVVVRGMMCVRVRIQILDNKQRTGDQHRFQAPGSCER